MVPPLTQGLEAKPTTTDHIVAAHIRPSGCASFATTVGHTHLPVPQTSGASAGEKTLSALGETPTSYALNIYSYEDTSIVPTPKDSRRFQEQVLNVSARRSRPRDIYLPKPFTTFTET